MGHRARRDVRVEGLRWALIAAVGGAQVSLVSCAGKSSSETSGPSPNAGSGTVSGDGGSAAGTGGTADVDGGASAFACSEQAKWTSTLDSCSDSFVHRRYPVACSIPNHDDTGDGMAEPGEAGELSACQADVDCLSGQFCVATPTGGRCLLPCYDDAACDSGSICVCSRYSRESDFSSVELGTCVTADCSVDADCVEGFLCSAPLDLGIGCPREPRHFACQTPEDECAGVADCPELQICTATVPRRCVSAGACGRPFLVGGVARSAPSIASSSWLDREVLNAPLEGLECGAESTLGGLDAAARELVARHWLEAGAMEHASVAAFARFALELLSLGAPAHLVEAATAAMADETRHARLCYGLAARYSGMELGPGPLDVRDALAQGELHAVVERAVLEGCIGETQAALEAAWAADAATDPVVRGVLGRIAADEARHAALAFELVVWASERDASVRRLVEGTLDRARASAEQDFARAPTEPEQLGTNVRRNAAALAAHGVLGPRARADARRAALAGVLPAVWCAALAPVSGRSAPRQSAASRPARPAARQTCS